MRPIAPVLLFFAMHSTSSALESPHWLDAASPTVEAMASQARAISAERRAVLDEAAGYVADRLSAGEPVRLTFICTHNSRRSHLAQVWAQIAAEFYGLPGVETYSGGTEATACNGRTVRALRRAGLEVVDSTGGDNPKYLLQYAENRNPLVLYSKVYDQRPNPTEGYAAMMCCADVDEQCPVVNGAAVRIPLHYVDPKVSDDTPREAATYDERTKQIGAEMFYVFSQAAQKLDG